MSDFKILKKGEKAESLYGIENKKITELELEALLDGKRIWTDINWEYAMTIQLKDKSKELELDKEINRLNNIINETRRILGEYAHYSTPTEEQNAKNEAIVDEAYMQLHNNLNELKGYNK